MLSILKGKPSSLTRLSFVLLGLSLLIKLIGTFWVKRQISFLTREYSYVGSDFPEVWPIPLKRVVMQFENPKHFRLDSEDGALEWAAVVPQKANSPNGVVHLGPQRQPYTVGMMHQLNCLDVVRQEMVRDRSQEDGQPSISPIGRHCLNYIRQMVMCRGDLELESFQFASHKNPIDWRGVYECKDWEGLFNVIEENQEEHEQWLKGQASL